MSDKQQLIVRVVTTQGGVTEDIREINFYDYKSRQWLAKHCWWAMHNNRAVTTQAMKDHQS